MPDSLYSKVEKFYSPLTVSSQAGLGVMSPQDSAALIAELLDWVDQLWESGVMQEAGTTYAEYIEFREAIKKSAPSY